MWTIRGRPAQRNERDDVDRAHARMDAAVFREVDEPDRRARERERTVLHALRRPEEGEDRAVMIGVAVHVHESSAPGLDGAAERVDDRRVTSLAHVRHALEERIGHADPPMY